MKPEEKIEAVEMVFKGLDEHLAKLSDQTGLKCVEHCSLCCRKGSIEATPIEFYPLAAYLHRTAQIDAFVEKLDKLKGHELCVLLDTEAQQNGTWGCTAYPYRGLICRMFGFGFRLNRIGNPELVTCKTMRTSFPASVTRAFQLSSDEPDNLPVFRDYSMQLWAIDPELTGRPMPINQAIRIAVEKIYSFFAYQKQENDTKVIQLTPPEDHEPPVLRPDGFRPAV